MSPGGFVNPRAADAVPAGHAIRVRIHTHRSRIHCWIGGQELPAWSGMLDLNTYSSRPRKQISIGCTTHDRQHNHGQSIRKETGDRTIRGLLQHSPPAIQCSIRYAHPARRYGCRRAATRPTHRAHIPVQATPNRSANQGPLGSGTIRKRPDLIFRQGDKHASRNIGPHNVFIGSCLLGSCQNGSSIVSQSLY